MHGNSPGFIVRRSLESVPRDASRPDEAIVDGHAVVCAGLRDRDATRLWSLACHQPARWSRWVGLWTPVDAAGTEWRATMIDDNNSWPA